MVRFPRGVLAVCPMSHPLWRWPLVRMRHRVGNVLKDQDYCESIGASPRNSVECELGDDSDNTTASNSTPTGDPDAWQTHRAPSAPDLWRGFCRRFVSLAHP